MNLSELQSRIDKIDGFYGALKSRQVALDEEIRMQKDEMDLLSKASHVLKHMLDVMVKDDRKSVV